MYDPQKQQAAKAELDRLFDALQGVTQKIQRLRDAGTPYDSVLHDEWEAAHRLFTEAHATWQKLLPVDPTRVMRAGQ